MSISAFGVIHHYDAEIEKGLSLSSVGPKLTEIGVGARSLAGRAARLVPRRLDQVGPKLTEAGVGARTAAARTVASPAFKPVALGAGVTAAGAGAVGGYSLIHRPDQSM